MFAYGDSHGDAELLARADHPVLVDRQGPGPGRRAACRLSPPSLQSGDEAAPGAPVASPTDERLPDALRERVLVFDGAAGTNLQTAGLTLDDFGGPELEGCNEILNVTRPDVIAGLHDSFFAVGCDAVETNTFGAFSIVLAEYAIPERAFELARSGAAIAREVADGYAADGRPRFVVGSIGPGTKLPSLGAIAFADLRDAYEVDGRRPARRRGRRAPRRDGAGPAPGQGRRSPPARRAMARAGPRRCPLMIQVTVETTGACSSARRSARRSRRSTRCAPTSSGSTARPAPRR